MHVQHLVAVVVVVIGRRSWYSSWWGNAKRAVRSSCPASYHMPFSCIYIYVIHLLTGHPFSNWLMPIVTVPFWSVNLPCTCSVWDISSLLPALYFSHLWTSSNCIHLLLLQQGFCTSTSVYLQETQKWRLNGLFSLLLYGNVNAEPTP